MTNYSTGAFNGCTYLQSIRLPATPTQLGYTMFTGCSRLTSVILPEGIKDINTGAFQSCTALKTLVLPSTVTIIRTSAFNATNALASLTVLATTPPTLSGNVAIRSACNIYVPSGSLDAYKSAWSSYSAKIQAIQG